MAVLHQNVPDEILDAFNKIARKKFGDKKGAKHSALLEALGDWIKANNENKAKKTKGGLCE